MAEAGHRFYSEDEAEDILRLASSLTPDAGRMSRERLLETAAELGISPEAVELAEMQLATQREDRTLRHEFHHRQRQEFNSHVAAFVVIAAFMTMLNLLTGLHNFWAIWVILCWLPGLLLHAYFGLNQKSTSYETGFERWRVKALKKRDGLATTPELTDDPSVQRPFVIGVHVGTGSRVRRDRR